jgi:hypothetical protein
VALPALRVLNFPDLSISSNALLRSKFWQVLGNWHSPLIAIVFESCKVLEEIEETIGASDVGH